MVIRQGRRSNADLVREVRAYAIRASSSAARKLLQLLFNLRKFVAQFFSPI